jgi:hypothetical protein
MLWHFPEASMRFLLPTLTLLAALHAFPQGDPFLVKPYLQLGDRALDNGALSLVWHGPDPDPEDWAVEVRTGVAAPWREDPWRPMGPPSFLRVAVPGVEPHRVWQCELEGLAPGLPFAYRVLRKGEEAFQARGMARKGPGQEQLVAVAAGLGEAGPGQRDVAFRIAREDPDLVLLAGDMINPLGRVEDFRANLAAAFNADGPESQTGGDLMRRRVLVGVPGDHEVAGITPPSPLLPPQGRRSEPDGHACYYLYFRQPLNGPEAPSPASLEPPERWRPFLEAAGRNYPTMGSFSFETGDAHWTALDSNPDVDWTSPRLREWLERDLEGAQDKPWRVVFFHHDPFNGGSVYPYDQWMRRLAPVFERFKVSLVLTGHEPTYQRTFPLRFVPAASRGPGTQVEGDIQADFRFGWQGRTRTGGVVYVGTGAGGARMEEGPWCLEPWMVRMVNDRHSFSLLRVRPESLEFRQMDSQGRVLDHFLLTRDEPPLAAPPLQAPPPHRPGLGAGRDNVGGDEPLATFP